VGSLDHQPGGVPSGGIERAEVIVYYGDDLARLYQLRQWLPVVELIQDRHPVLVVTRHAHTFAAVQRITALPCALAPTLPELDALYRIGEPRVILYVNNSMRNFQSLAARSVLHVHVNHGESDKICMVSNQVKAYDRVFVAGQAAVDRYRAGLLDFDPDRLVTVGRPQLDLRPEPVLPPSSRRTVLYAPTWEGEEPANDYTSLDVLGPGIIAAALAVPDVRVVYKPHPRVATSTRPGMVAAHRRVTAMLRTAARRDRDAGHRQESAAADVLAVMPGCDVMITDVSSVGLDFLCLHTDKPLFVADRYADPDRLDAAAPVSRCADVVDAGTLGTLGPRIADRLAHDEHAAERAAMRRYYFGDLGPGESTERFLAAIDDAVITRDRLVARRSATGPAIALSAVEPVLGWMP
jgi:CDP-Glycerol:Poly(glycerophosphate) glycerophosphotransferase